MCIPHSTDFLLDTAVFALVSSQMQNSPYKIEPIFLDACLRGLFSFEYYTPIEPVILS
jgi:hypothetical protein